MDILLIGGTGSIMDAVINKLNKEGNRIFVLTGNREKRGSYGKTFEKYYFTYESDSVKEVFESVDPDVTVFMGAFDTNFDWSQARREAVRYSAGIVNVVMAYASLKRGRFIYLSSDEVYADSCPNDIREEEPVSAGGFRVMALCQGEELVKNYSERMDLDMVTLRLDHLYYIPRDKKEVMHICGKMCLEALRTGKVPANGRNTFSLLYLSDAVEFIYQIICCEAHERSLYHVSSARPVSEMDVAEMIRECAGDKAEIVDNSVGNPYRVILCNKRYDAEFGITVFHEPEEIIRQMYRYMRKHSERFLNQEDDGSGLFQRFSRSMGVIIRKLIPFIENLICFIPFFMLNNRAVGSRYFARLDFYLLYVLLFAIVYGQQQAILSAILAIAGYCFRQMYNRSSFEVLMDYNTYVWIAQLFILGLVVGYMKDQLRVIREENQEEMSFVTEQLDDIADINSSNVRVKNVLITQMVNQSDSFGKIHEITSGLGQYQPAEVLFYAVEAVAKLLETEDAAIYQVANPDYGRLFSATSERARSLGKSIRFEELPEMMEALQEKRVFINKKLDEKYPLMADGIYSDKGMQMILMVWGLPWNRMTLSQANKLVVIGELIQEAVLRADQYLEVLENERYVHGTRILGEDAFESLVRAFLDARLRGLTECTVLHIQGPESEQEEMAEKLARLLRHTDYLGRLKDGNLYILLSNTERADAEPVIRRCHEVGILSEIQEELEV